MRKFTGAMIVAGALFGATAVQAASVTYNFSGPFDAPATGSVAGSITFDDATGVVTAFTAGVTAGKAMDGVTDLTATAFSLGGLTGPAVVSYAQSFPAAGIRGGMVSFAPGLNNPGRVMVEFQESPCANADCSALVVIPAATRVATVVAFSPAPAPVAIPTMTEWAMILFGLLLAGGAVVTLRGRRTA